MAQNNNALALKVAKNIIKLAKDGLQEGLEAAAYVTGAVTISMALLVTGMTIVDLYKDHQQNQALQQAQRIDQFKLNNGLEVLHDAPGIGLGVGDACGDGGTVKNMNSNEPSVRRNAFNDCVIETAKGQKYKVVITEGQPSLPTNTARPAL